MVWASRTGGSLALDFPLAIFLNELVLVGAAAAIAVEKSDGTRAGGAGTGNSAGRVAVDGAGGDFLRLPGVGKI